jgi:outer membrane protein assembly factor BamB
VDTTNGKVIWNERLDGEFSASPVLIGGNIYCCNQIGKTFVLATGRTFNVVAENRLDGRFMASPAVAGEHLYLRTNSHLYCVGKK